MAKKKIGRPTRYSKRLADKICALLAEGRSLRTVCRDPKMPGASTVFAWLRKYEDFQQQYARAKEEAADALVEEILDIADDGTNDWMKLNIKGREVTTLNKEHVQRSRLRIDTRKWIASKLKPKKYGEKLDLTTQGDKLPTPIYGGKSLDE